MTDDFPTDDSSEENSGEYYWSTHDIGVSLTGMESDFDAYAEVRAYQFPDGSVKNSLSPDELREVASMLTGAADRLEDDRNE